MGYFVAAGSKKHHRFEGGLLSHSLETYHKAMELREKMIEKGCDLDLLPVGSVVIASLMHDLCKADELRYDPVSRSVYSLKKTHGHSQRSVRQVGYSGFELTPMETDAILWHMGGKRYHEDRWKHFSSHPLSHIIYWADKYSIQDHYCRR